MANPVPAGSLASVIDLADNPPEQPLHSLTNDLQQPLVLYIARVPGSHGTYLPLPKAKDKGLIKTLDVFLTTMKPQQKVVTAQDVQSSLYYLHLDRPEDYALLDSFGDSENLSDDEEGHGKPTDPTGTAGVRRKPLPPSPMLGTGDRLEYSPQVSAYLQNHSNNPTGSRQAEQKPLSQDNVAEHQRKDASPQLPDRKLLGPRSMNQRFLSLDHSPLQNVPEKQNIDLRRWSEQPVGAPSKLPPRPLSGGRHSVPIALPRPLGASLKDAPVANGGHSRFLHRKPVAHSASHDSDRQMKDESNAQEIKDSSLSLIRRYNNEQWNVGKISSKGAKTAVGGHGESSHEISIHIMTQGYLRFIDPINPFAKHAVTITENPDDPCENETPITAAEEQLCFQRHLQVPGHAMGQNQRHSPESNDSTFIYQGIRPSFDLPRYSHQSSDSTQSHPSFTNGVPELTSGSRKAYILRSPWGVCEFTTGVAGRSFKCKHSYRSSNQRSGSGMHSAQVSELRFNLPSSKTLGCMGSKGLVHGAPGEAKRSSLFLPQHGRQSSSSSGVKDMHGTGYFAPKVELEERLDLSLGQEHAGGGFGGKQAKLGKLIIEKEGLQMLDLIVAANMALWWRVYERFT